MPLEKWLWIFQYLIQNQFNGISHLFHVLCNKIMSKVCTCEVCISSFFHFHILFFSFQTHWNIARYLLLEKEKKKRADTHTKEWERRKHSHFIQRVVPFMKINLRILAFIALVRTFYACDQQLPSHFVFLILFFSVLFVFNET